MMRQGKHYQHGILTYRRVEKRDLDLLSSACGANLVPDAGRATKADLGAFIKTREELRGGVNHWILDAEDSGATLIAEEALKASSMK